MNSFLKLTTFAVVFFAYSISAVAQQRYNNTDRSWDDRQEQMQKFRNDKGALHHRVMQMLDLSAEQKESIQEIHLNGQKKMLPLRMQLQEKHARLQTLTVSEEYDESAINEVISEISTLHKTMLTMRISHRQQVRELLTDEQRIKFDTFHLKMDKRHHRMAAGR